MSHSEVGPPSGRLPQGVRQPVQARSRERFERILTATETLIEAVPLAQLSVAMVAQRSGVKRATIYQFFVSVRSVLDTLGRRLLDELYDDIAALRRTRDWRQALGDACDATIAFYTRHPAACLLFLGDGSLHGLRVIDRDFDRRYASLLRVMLGDRPELQSGDAGDPIQITITVFVSVISLSVHIHGRITADYQREAKVAAEAYLASRLPG
ncbi:MAG TPA: TetR/AcrR family transcriptional regulator [Caulobacteraceae bacterium]|jgi:AcrR family transcriptional regulator|nr:TetR/AcrR family transcriptional regulator [Caulobacteraceae bacterium]